MQENQRVYYIIAAGAVVVTVVILATNYSSLSKKEEAKVRYGKVDDYKKKMIQKKRLEIERVKVENYRKAPDLTNGYRAVEVHDPNENQGITLESQGNAAERDAAEDSMATPDFSTQSQINKLLVKKQQYEQLTAAQKQKYISAFKREAKSLGFRIEFNDKLEVTHFQKIGSREGASEDNGYQGQEFYDEE